MYPDGTRCVTLTPGSRLDDVRSYMSSSHGDIYVAEQLQVTPQLIETSVHDGFTPKAVQWRPTTHGGTSATGSSLCSYSWGTGAWSLFYQIEVNGGFRLREYYFNNVQWNDTHLDWSIKLGSSIAVMDAPASGKPPQLVFQDTSDNICVFPLVKERLTQVNQPPNMPLVLAQKAKPLTGIGACVDSDRKTKRVYYQDSQGVIREHKTEGDFWDIVPEPVSDALPGVVSAISAIGDGQFGARVYALQSNGAITEYKRSGLKWFPTPVKTRSKPLSSANIVAISAPFQGIRTSVLWIGDDRRLYVNDCQSDGRWRGPRALFEFRYDEAKSGLRPGNRTPFDRVSTGSGATPGSTAGATHGGSTQHPGDCASPDSASTHHGSTAGGATSTLGPHQPPHGERVGDKEQPGHASGTRPPQPGVHTSPPKPPSGETSHGGSAATQGPHHDDKGAGVGTGGLHGAGGTQPPAQGSHTPGSGVGNAHGSTTGTPQSQHGGSPLTPGDSSRRVPSERTGTPTAGTHQPAGTGQTSTSGQSGQHGATSGSQHLNDGAQGPAPGSGGAQGLGGDRRQPGGTSPGGTGGPHSPSAGNQSAHNGERPSTGQHGGSPGDAGSQTQHGGSIPATGRGGSETRGPAAGNTSSSTSTPRPPSGVSPSTNDSGGHSVSGSGAGGSTPAGGANGHNSGGIGVSPAVPSPGGQPTGANTTAVHPTSPSPNGHATEGASAGADAATSPTAAAKYRPGKVIRRVCMHIKRGVEGIKVVYDNGQETAWRGLSSGDETKFELDADEYITHVWYAADGGIVQGLLFGTSYGRESPWFGSQYGIFGLQKKDGSVLVDLEGSLDGGVDSLKPTWEEFSPMGDSTAHETEFNTLLGEFGKFQAGVSELKDAVHGMTDLGTEGTAEAFKVLVQNVEILRNQEDGIRAARVTANTLRETYRTAHISACRKSVETLLKLLEELAIRLKPLSGEFASAVEDRRQEGEALYKKLGSLLDRVKQYRQKLGKIADGLAANELFWAKEVEQAVSVFAKDKETFKQTMKAKGASPLEPEDDYGATLWGLQAWRRQVSAKATEDVTVDYIINSTVKSNSRAHFTRSQVDFLKATTSRIASLMKKMDDLSGRISPILEELRRLIDGLGDHQPERNSDMKGASQLLGLIKKSIEELEKVKAADDSRIFAKPTYGTLGPLLQNPSFKWGSVDGKLLLEVSRDLCA